MLHIAVDDDDDIDLCECSLCIEIYRCSDCGSDREDNGTCFECSNDKKEER